MKVKALRQGYYGHKRISADEIFNLDKSKDFSEAWMIKASSVKKRKVEEVEDVFADNVDRNEEVI